MLMSENQESISDTRSSRNSGETHFLKKFIIVVTSDKESLRFYKQFIKKIWMILVLSILVQERG